MIKATRGSWCGYKQTDWYAIDVETAKPLFYQGSVGLAPVPGVRDATAAIKAINEGRNAEVVIHRTHLPLLTSSEALKFLTPVQAEDWSARIAWAAERGFEFRTTQHQAIDFIAPRRGVLLGDDMRLGKGHPAGTRILTPAGWRPVEQLRSGDQVIGSNGRPCVVTGLYDRGVLPVFKVTFSDGASVRVDDEHLWLAWDHNAWHRGSKPWVIDTASLSFDLRYSNGNRKWRIPLVKPIEFEKRDLSIDPYVLGVLLGDGSLTHGTPSFVPGDVDVPEQVGKRLPAGTHLSFTKSESRATVWRITGDNLRQNPVLDALRAIGLQGKKSPQKFIPHEYLFASIEQRLALLRGLMDTDGEWCDGILAFSSSSKDLANGVKFLVESLGGLARESVREFPKYTLHGEERIGLPSYRLTIAMPEGASPFLARSGYEPRKKYHPSRLFESIEPAGSDRVYCISVDAPDQLYVVEHCIVTHNTLTCIASHDPARGPLVIVAPLSTRAVWLGWVRRCFPDLPVGVLTGKSKMDPERMNRPIVFCHYDILKYWQTAMRIGTLVLDEAHLICNRKTDRAKAVAVVASRAEKIIAATGTPIWDMPPDLWNVIGLLAPAAWGSYWDFGMRYGMPEHTGYGVVFNGSSNTDELSVRLSEVKIRRLWRDVQKDLPPISRNIVVSEIDETTSRKLDILAAKLKKERTNTAANLAIYRSQLCKVKLDTVIREAVHLMEGGNPIVIWTWHKEFAEQIHERLNACSYLIHGDVAPDERERRMEMWRQNKMHPQASERPLALVATMAVAQVGIDLSHSHLPIFAELDYVPAVIGQTEMRTFDPKRAMNVTFVVANHVVDQRLVRALVSKLNAADPLGFGAAVDAIDALREAFEGPRDDPDMERFLDDVISSAFEVS